MTLCSGTVGFTVLKASEKHANIQTNTSGKFGWTMHSFILAYPHVYTPE